MVATSLFPSATTSGQGLFDGASSTGLIQGHAEPDPAVRYRLRGGILSAAEILPCWGGVGLYQFVPPISASGSVVSLGPTVGRATGLTGSYPLTGFSVSDQAYNQVTSPSSPVQYAGSGEMVNLYPLGSLARVAVKCDPALVSLRGGSIDAHVSWDFVNQILVPYIGTLTISSGTYNNTTGVVTLTMSATVGFSAGDSIVVSSLTGTGAYAGLNGTFTVLSASGSTVTYNAGAGVGASTITGGSLTLGSGASSALPVKVLRVEPTNSMTIDYDVDTGFATWNYSGCAALIQI